MRTSEKHSAKECSKPKTKHMATTGNKLNRGVHIFFSIIVQCSSVVVTLTLAFFKVLAALSHIPQ